MIGTHYSKKNYCCANFVADWYKQNFKVSIPTGAKTTIAFVVWMRRHFQRVVKPQNHDLVLMVNIDGSYHIGVYSDYGVYHNFKPSKGLGSVVKWPLRSVKSYYSKVSYFRWSQLNTTPTQHKKNMK